MNWKKTILICGIVLLTGAGIMTFIFSTEPTAKREGAMKKSAMLVDVTRIERGSFRPVIVALGTVEAERDIILSPRVSGELIERSPAFTPGGRVDKGELLLRIDPADFRNTLQQRKSELQQAQADLNIEMGRQDVARQDYELYEGELSADNKALVLRQPQLETARARVEAARAAVRQAELDLQRTVVKAPFNAHILERNVDVGSQVAAGAPLGRLVGLDTYWVVATVPLKQLHMISFPDESGPPSKVKVYNPSAWPDNTWRSGQVLNLVGSLAEQTRMARILVGVPDPLATQVNSEDKPELMIGSFVEAHIEGKNLDDVMRLDRDYVRKNDTVWVNQNGKLQIKSVDVAFRDAEYAYIASGLDETEEIVTTNLRTVTEGVSLRVKEAGEKDSGSQSGTSEGTATGDDGQ